MDGSLERLKQTAKDEEKVKKEISEVHVRRRDQRVKAVLELKTNMENAAGELQGLNEKRQLREMEEKREEKRIFNELVSQGKNPYEVFRRRTIQKRAQKKLKAQKSKIQQAEMDIAKRMIADDARLRAKEAIEKKHKDYVDKYQSELGRKSKEDRIQRYMIEKTSKELVDPTGRVFRIEPSQVTTIKDHSFGLGKSSVKSTEQRDAIIDIVRSKTVHQDVEPIARFIPKLQTEQQQPKSALNKEDVDTDEMLGTIPGSTGSGNLAVKVNSVGNKPKRTKLEEKLFQNALQRQKDNMVQKQIVWGKEFKGQAFLSTPNVLWFKDFTVNEPTTLKFQLTNVSNTFNHFKILSLPDRYKDFFEISYTKPGRMSAGMTCSLSITFSPKLNDDIEIKIPMLAKTGKFFIPLRCTTKKAAPVVDQNIVAFPRVVRGETTKLSVVLKNEGALQLPYTIRLKSKQFETEKASCDDATSFQDGNAKSTEEIEFLETALGYYEAKEDPSIDPVRSPADGILERYSSKTLTFVFSPMECGEIERMYEIEFPELDPISLQLSGLVVDVPIYAENRLIDFRSCCDKKLYRSKLILRNRGRVALKCTVKVPSELQECIEFLPGFGYVQGSNGAFEFQVKFRPQLEQLLKRCEKYIIKTLDSKCFFAVPIHVDVSGQTLPAHFVITASICKPDLSISTSKIDFKRCFTDRTCTKRIEIQNMCQMPQKFGFVKLNSCVSLTPNGGFGLLLPGEKRSIDVKFSPTSAIAYNFNLICRTTLNQEYIVQCFGQGVTPVLQFSDTVVEFGAIAALESTSYSIVVQNTSPTPQTAEFIIPQGSNLSIRPQVIRNLPPSESLRIEIEFHALDALPESTSDKAIPSLMIGRKDNDVWIHRNTDEMELESQDDACLILPSIASEPLSAHYHWMIPCICQSDTTALPIEVRATVVPKDLTVDQTSVDFGQIAVGCTKIVKLQIVNTSAEEIDIQMEPLHALGPYSVINAIRSVPGEKGFQNIFIRFCPVSSDICLEKLTLISPVGSLNIKLKGEGVSPTLCVEPEDGIVDLGHILAGERTEATLKLRNASVFPLQYVIESLNDVESNFNNVPVFSLIPNQGSISPDGQREVIASFSVDHGCAGEIVQKFKVQIPNQAIGHTLTLKGRCWERQAYVMSESTAPCNFDAIHDVFALPTQVDVVPEDIGAQKRRICVELDGTETTKQLVVGCVDMQNKKNSASSSFEISSIDDKNKNHGYFAVEPMKGTMTPGQQHHVTVRFTPPPNSKTDESSLNLGQWVEVKYTCILKGGYIPVSCPDKEEEVTLILRGYIYL